MQKCLSSVIFYGVEGTGFGQNLSLPVSSPWEPSVFFLFNQVLEIHRLIWKWWKDTRSSNSNTRLICGIKPFSQWLESKTSGGFWVKGLNYWTTHFSSAIHIFVVLLGTELTILKLWRRRWSTQFLHSVKELTIQPCGDECASYYIAIPRAKQRFYSFFPK